MIRSDKLSRCVVFFFGVQIEFKPVLNSEDTKQQVFFWTRCVKIANRKYLTGSHKNMTQADFLRTELESETIKDGNCKHTKICHLIAVGGRQFYGVA